MTFGDGVSYFFRGFSLLKTKGLKRFVLVPLIVNFILFITAFNYLLDYIGEYINWVNDNIPDWLSWLEFLLFPFVVLAIIVLFGLFFTTVANWLAAPFNGVLAERVEMHLTGQQPKNSSIAALIKATPHTLLREWKKLVYFIPRMLGFFLIGWFFPVIGQIIWFLFIAWVLAIQYCDYAFDNNEYSFDFMRYILGNNRSACFGFGASVSVITMLPLINLIVMPAAICGATLMWVEQLGEQTRDRSLSEHD
jgi:CysZ protein